MIVVNIKTGDEEFQIEHKPETCTEDDLQMICFALKRFLREAFGRSPNPMLSRPE